MCYYNNRCVFCKAAVWSIIWGLDIFRIRLSIFQENFLNCLIESFCSKNSLNSNIIRNQPKTQNWTSSNFHIVLISKTSYHRFWKWFQKSFKCGFQPKITNKSNQLPFPICYNLFLLSPGPPCTTRATSTTRNARRSTDKRTRTRSSRSLISTTRFSRPPSTFSTRHKSTPNLNVGAWICFYIYIYIYVKHRLWKWYYFKFWEPR